MSALAWAYHSRNEMMTTRAVSLAMWLAAMSWVPVLVLLLVLSLTGPEFHLVGGYEWATGPDGLVAIILGVLLGMLALICLVVFRTTINPLALTFA